MRHVRAEGRASPLSTRARRSLFNDVILVEDVAHKVAVVELMHQLAVDFRRQVFKPLGIVASQGNIQRQNILYFF